MPIGEFKVFYLIHEPRKWKGPEGPLKVPREPKRTSQAAAVCHPKQPLSVLHKAKKHGLHRSEKLFGTTAFFVSFAFHVLGPKL